MKRGILPGLAFAALLSLASAAAAQTPGKIDTEAAGMILELVGAPVFTADGTQVGEVADISIDEEGRPTRLLVKRGAILGFGVHVVRIPDGAFTALRGAVVINLSANAVKSLPTVPAPTRAP